MSEQAKISPRSRRILLWVIPVAAAGILLSIELTRIYYTSLKDVEFDAFCSISERVDCISVALSSHSRILGIPNSLFGIAFHVAAILLVMVQLVSRRIVFRHARNYLFLLSLVGLAYSLYLGAISSFVLKSFCIYCTALYVVNIILFLLALATLDPAREFFRGFIADGRGLKQDSLVFGAVVSLSFMVIVAVIFQSWRVDLAAQKRLQMSLEGKKYELDLAGDPSFGPETAPVTIVEFTDYECPHCRRLHHVLKQTRKKYGPRVRVIYKSFPIYKDCNSYLGVNVHPHACEAAYATECAYNHGVFDEYRDVLFSSSSLAWEDLIGMAQELGLPAGEFEACMKSDTVWNAVQRDVYDASVLRLKGTPVFFVNGYKFEGYRNLKEMSNIIDAFLHGMQPRR